MIPTKADLATPRPGNRVIGKVRDYLSTKPFLFSLLRKVIEVNFIKQKQIIQRTYKEHGGGRILDIGCGTGEFSRLFERENYTGIDLSPSYIHFALKTFDRSFEVMDAKKLTYPDGSFDFILIMAVLHHLDDEEAAAVLKEARRVVKSDGLVLLFEDTLVPAMMNPLITFVQSKDLGKHIRPPEEYRNLIDPIFHITGDDTFRNGGCLYYSVRAKPR